MANLAIRGHATRGKEVIEILEMLGGKNTTNLQGECNNMIYIISSSYYGEIIYMPHRINGYVILSLEEFLEKFPYKVGDKVSSKYLKNYEVSKMEWESTNNRVIYKLQGMGWYSADELQPYKKETIEEQKQIPPYMDYDIRTEENIEETIKQIPPYMDYDIRTEETIKIDIPKGYEFFGIDGDNKVILTKKQFQYPKTYEECAKELGYNQVMSKDHILGYKGSLLSFFQQLLICRDAYWLLAGEQMGLGKPWEPELNSMTHKFALSNVGGHISFEVYGEYNSVLCFPTEEMRSTFFENFKELIEICKELL